MHTIFVIMAIAGSQLTPVLDFKDTEETQCDHEASRLNRINNDPHLRFYCQEYSIVNDPKD